MLDSANPNNPNYPNNSNNPNNKRQTGLGPGAVLAGFSFQEDTFAGPLRSLQRRLALARVHHLEPGRFQAVRRERQDGLGSEGVRG